MVSRFHRFNDTGDVAVAAMHAGVDLNSGGVYSKLAASVKAGLVSESMIDTAVTRYVNFPQMYADYNKAY